jgi:predicted amidohydrolase
MRLALAQIRVEPGLPEANLARADRAIGEAARAGAEIVVLPETLDCGWTHPSARALAGGVPDGEACVRLRESARRHRIWVCAGLVERNGARLHNAAILVSAEGTVVHHHRKIHELDFARELYDVGNRVETVETPWGRGGVVICADAFAEGLVHTRALGRRGARWILSPCAWAVPPERDLVSEPYGGLWKESYGPVCREFGMSIAGCSNVGPVVAGAWTGWRCIGSSMVVGPQGEILAVAPAGDDAEVLLVVQLPGPESEGDVEDRRDQR